MPIRSRIFLNLNPIEDIHPLSWLRAFKELIVISRPVTPAEQASLQAQIAKGRSLIMMPNPEAAFIRQTLHRYTSDKIIAAYLAYEDAFAPSYVSFEELGSF